MSTDPISDMLRVIRVGGAIVLHDAYQAPWAVTVPEPVELSRLVAAQGADRVVAFHLVQSGWLDVATSNGSVRRIDQGDLIVLFAGAHCLRRGDHARPVPLATLMGLPDRPPPPSRADDATTTTLLCGVFVLEHLNRTPLLDSLPDLVHVRAEADPELTGLAAHLSGEVAGAGLGSSFMISRLLEVVLGHAVRTLARSNGATNWFAAVDDPVVSIAVRAIHADPSAPWTVQALAGQACISRSRLTARFRATLREGPMHYLTRWRMILAADLLDTTDLSVEQVGLRVGYSNQPAFTRAFRRHHGVAPRQWRSDRPG